LLGARMVQRGVVVSKKGSTGCAGLNMRVKRASEVAVAARRRGQCAARSGFGDRGWWNRRLRSFADGCRGVQRANFCSEGFKVLIFGSFQARLEFGESITVPTGDGIW
jgi:hypothetical protein